MDNNIAQVLAIIDTLPQEHRETLEALIQERDGLAVETANLAQRKQELLVQNAQLNARIAEIDTRIYALLPPNPLGMMEIGV